QGLHMQHPPRAGTRVPRPAARSGAQAKPSGFAGYPISTTTRRTFDMSPDTAEQLLDVWKRPDPPEPREETGFFTDTTLCIGCKACEVACKQWNQLPADGFRWTGTSYDNT